ncbi:ATP-binding cassette sub-family C member 2-like [Ixodes scapularis]
MGNRSKTPDVRYSSAALCVFFNGSLIAATNQSGKGTLILLFLATATAESMISCYMLYLSMRLGLRIRSMLQAAIFKKITRLSPTSRSDNPPGYVVAVMAMDCMQLSINLVQFTDPIVGMTCMPIVFYLLATRVGTIPALCCAAWLLAAILLPFPTSRLQNAIWGRVMRFRDDRVKRLTDLLTSVRLVKMCAWEDAYMHAVKELRAKEMVPLFLANLLDGFIDSVYSASGSVTTTGPCRRHPQQTNGIPVPVTCDTCAAPHSDG